jgi:hypothetical protein
MTWNETAANPCRRNGELDNLGGVPEPRIVVEPGDAVEQRPLVAPPAAVPLGLCCHDHSLTYPAEGGAAPASRLRDPTVLARAGHGGLGSAR